jgi:hypothetical protein
MKTLIIKKRIILVLVTIMVSTSLFAQSYMPLPDSNAHWIVNSYDSDFSFYYLYGLSSHANDTIINSISYTKLYSYLNWGSDRRLDQKNDMFPANHERINKSGFLINRVDSTYIGAFRNAPGGKTFFIPNTDMKFQEEVLLHDFSANVGDTVRQVAIYNVYEELGLYDCKVDSVKYKTNGPYSHKCLYLTPVDSLLYYLGNSLVWVEKIGSLNNGILNSVECFAVTDALICMSANDTVFYTDDAIWPGCFYPSFELTYESGNCMEPNGIGDKKNNNILLLSAYPNPSSDYVVFEMQKAVQNSIITIFDITGRPVAAFPLTGEKTVWETAGVKPGVYLYKLQTPDGFGSGKLLLSP